MQHQLEEWECESVCDCGCAKKKIARLRAALERLIKDYEDETDSPAAAARAALKEVTP